MRCCYECVHVGFKRTIEPNYVIVFGTTDWQVNTVVVPLFFAKIDLPCTAKGESLFWLNPALLFVYTFRKRKSFGNCFKINVMDRN